LAFEIFKKNSDILRENVCSFRRPSESSEFQEVNYYYLILERQIKYGNLIKELRTFGREIILMRKSLVKMD